MQIIFTDGLGNEMFQYALYLGMIKNGKRPCINIGLISRGRVHNGFELCDDFTINRTSLKIIDGGKFGGGVTTFAIRHLKKMLCFREDDKLFCKEVFNTRKPLVYGYWQDERYFKDYSSEVRKAFTFRNLDEVNVKIGEEMASSESVAIHIRRGDYLKHPELMVCSPDYYKRAISYMKEHLTTPFFYVFSDDLNWSERFMNECDVPYKLVEHNRGKNSYKDMYLMTCCHHNIIANSSFSWWGAWLGGQANKTVLCPDVWFLDNPKKHPAPNHWIRIAK